MPHRIDPLLEPFSPGPHKVSASSLLPEEQPTPLKQLKALDTYQQYFVKYPKRGTFHSYPELLHGALLESEPAVESFVPHPFRLRIGSQTYIPDCYLVRSGVRIVRECNEADLPDKISAPVRQFLAQNDIQWEVLPNSVILEKETLALNWLQIVQTLVSAKGHQTMHAEGEIHLRLAEEGSLSLMMLLDGSDDFEQFDKQVAVFRMLHKGLITAELNKEDLNYHTEFQLCG